MKTLIGLTALASLVATIASAGALPEAPNSRDSSPVAMVGISYNFGGRVVDETVGLTFKVLSSDRQDRAVVAAGVSYFPWAPKEKFGLDISTGYNFDKVTALVGYDLLNKKPQASLGYTNTYKPTRAVTCQPGFVLIGQACQPFQPA